MLDAIFMAIVAAAEPETTPQISPITSLQKLETWSAFLISARPVLPAFIFCPYMKIPKFTICSPCQNLDNNI